MRAILAVIQLVVISPPISLWCGPQEIPVELSLDPVMLTAIKDFGAASGYAFDAVRSDLDLFEAFSAPTRARGVLLGLSEFAHAMTRTTIHGRSERGEPLHFATESLEAFRADGRIVSRRFARGQWGPWVKADAPIRSDPDPEVRLLRALACLPTPDELLDDLAGRTSTCSRKDDAKHKDVATFECRIRPDPGWMLHLPGSTAAPANLALCTLRVTIDHGKLTQIELETPAPDDASRAHAIGAGSPATANVVVHYRIDAVGSTKVRMPVDAARLLGSR